jgi:hypothetical protein
MKYLFFAALLCVTGCKQDAETPVENNAAEKPKRHRSIVPEPPNLVIPNNAKIKSYTLTRYFDGFEDRNDTVFVQEIALDTAKVFIYRHISKTTGGDTLILGKGGSYRSHRTWGTGVTKYISEKDLMYNGKPVKVEKYTYFTAKAYFNFYANHSLGLIFVKAQSHPSGSITDVYINKAGYSELHNAIIKDTVFTKMD